MAYTAIASTQKAGEGDATILGNNSRPIAENLLAQSAQQSRQKAQGDLLKSKQVQENQTKFFNNLGGLKEKVWLQDIPEITGDVNALIEKAVQMQKGGINPFDPSNGAAYTELYGDIEKLQAKQEASKSAETLFNNSYATFKSNKDGDFDYELTKSKLDGGANKKILERSTDDFGLVYAPVNAMGVLDKTFSDNLKAQFAVAKTYNDKNLTQEANDVISAIKTSTIPAARLMLDKYVVQGRMTPEDADMAAKKYVEEYQQKALFDPTKNEDQALAAQKEARIKADQDRRFQLANNRFSLFKSMQEVKSTEVDDLFKSIAEGLPVSTMALAGQIILDPESNKEVKTGAFIPIKNKEGRVVGVKIDKYDENGNKVGVINSPLYDSKNRPIYSSTQIYQSKFKDAVKSKTPAINYTINESGDFEIIDEDPKSVGTKLTNTDGSSGSSANKTYTIINPNNGDVIQSGVSKDVADKAKAKGYKIK